MARPVVRYAITADGLEIAYQVLGDGPLDVVIVPALISNLDHDAQFPFYAGYLRRFPRFARTIMLDKRGSGLSARELGSGSPEDRMDDVRAVMDAVGSRRAALLGQHDGGPIAMLFAATYPERVSALVLINTSARRHADRDYEGPTPEELEGTASAFEESWGTGRSIFPFVSDVPDAEAALELLAVIERSIGTPRSVGRQARLAFALDVRSALPLIEAPTLICRLELSVVPPVQMRYLAEHIRGARYVERIASLSLSWDFAKQDPALDTIEEFLTGQRPTPTVDIERSSPPCSSPTSSTRPAA